MPATGRGISKADYVLGVDGCRAGWIYAQRFLLTDETRVAIADKIAFILDGPGRGAAAGIIDIPIGLAAAGSRNCETDARRMLGPRRSSVFASPTRSMLACATYEEANSLGKANGAGLSRQCWGIVPKIREVDAAMTPDLQDRFSEGHPELAFTRLRGEPCSWPKRTKDGKQERIVALKATGFRNVIRIHDDLRERHSSKSEFAIDDLLDACALTLTAEARLSGCAWRMGDGARDSRGLKMEI